MNEHLKNIFNYLSKEISEGKTDFRLVAHKHTNGWVRAYIHPFGKDGETVDLCLDHEGQFVKEFTDTAKALPGLPEYAEPLLQFFNYHHLPDHLKKVSAPFAGLAAEVIMSLPKNAERTTALRKLLEAKDCAVRATIYKGSSEN